MPIPPTAPTFDQLDSEPVVTLTRTDEVIEVGEEFTVTATLSGNEANILRAAEVEVAFDPDVLEFVSATESGLGMTGEGVIFTKAELLEDHETVGLVAGACGGSGGLPPRPGIPGCHRASLWGFGATANRRGAPHAV